MINHHFLLVSAFGTIGIYHGTKQAILCSNPIFALPPIWNLKDHMYMAPIIKGEFGPTHEGKCKDIG